MAQAKFTLDGIKRRIDELDNEVNFLREFRTIGGEYSNDVPEGLRAEFERLSNERREMLGYFKDALKRAMEQLTIEVEW